MAASYVLAMTLIPAYGAHFLHPQNEEERAKAPRGIFSALAAKLEALTEAYERGVRKGLAHRRLLLAGAGLTFLIALGLYPFLGKELFPPIDAGQFTILVRAPSGTRIELSEELASQVEAAVRDVIPPREINTIVANTGVLYDWPAAYTPNAGPMDSFLNVQLSEDHHTSAQGYVSRFRQVLPQKFPGVSFAFDTGGLLSAALNYGLPSPIDIQVIGNSLEVGQTIAREVEAQIRQVPGTADVRIQQKLDYPVFNIDVDRVKAAYLGLTQQDVVQNIVTALNSSVNFLPGFWIDERNGNHYFLGAQYPEDIIRNVSTLEDIPLTDPSPGSTPTEPTLLKSVAKITRGVAPLEVEHRSITRVTDIYANVSGRDIASVANDIQKRLGGIHVPSGYRMAMRGEIESMRESFAGLFFGLLMAMALVYLVMVAQFRSFLDPLIVLVTVPLSLPGTILILLLTGTTVNIQSFIGTIFLVGIEVSNQVLLIDFANRLRAEGMSAYEAVVKASRVRLRPILMTAAATLAAMLPMAIRIGTGAEANVPLSRAVIGGLLFSLLLTRFVVPSLYVTFKGSKQDGETQNAR